MSNFTLFEFCCFHFLVDKTDHPTNLIHATPGGKFCQVSSNLVAHFEILKTLIKIFFYTGIQYVQEALGGLGNLFPSCRAMTGNIDINR